MQNRGPTVPPRHLEREVYEILRRHGLMLQQITAGVAAVKRGETPDGSGLPLVDSTLFFYKPGLPGGQIARGATEPSGKLVLVSTANSTKGKIYLGLAESSAYDEVNDMLGIGTASPAVKIQANTSAVGTSTTGQFGTPMFRGSYAGTTFFDILPIQFDPGIYDVSIRVGAAGGAVQFTAQDGTAACRIVPTAGRAFIQTGIKNSGGVVSNDSMTIGGIGATTGTSLGVVFEQVHFSNTGSTFPQIGVGVGLDPASFSGTWRGVVALKADSSSTPALSLFPSANSTGAPMLEVNRQDLFGASLRRLLSFEYDATNTNPQGRLTVWNGASSPTRAGWISSVDSPFDGVGGTYSITVFDRNGRRSIEFDSGSLWSDSITSGVLSLGQTVSTHNGSVIGGVGLAILTRLGISSAHTLISNGASSTAASFPAPEATPSVLRLLNTAASGADGSIVLKLQSNRAGQSGDFLQIMPQAGTAIAGINSAGAYYLVTGGATGRIYTSDSGGVGSWGLASALATRVQQRWVANGPYRVDTSVDGGWIAPTAMTISAVWLHRTTAGTSGSTILDLNKNGVTMYTTAGNRPTIPFNQVGNKVQATLPDIVAVAAGDILTIDIDQIEGGSPQHVSLIIEGA